MRRKWEEEVLKILAELREKMEKIREQGSEEKEVIQKLAQETATLTGEMRLLKEVLRAEEEKKEKEKKEKEKAIVLIDGDNLFRLLEELNLAFPGEVFLEEVKETLGKIAAILLFYHRIPGLYLASLRKAGYWLIHCPPLSFMGKDTVDETIGEMSRFIAEIDSLDPVVIVSGDKDMIFPVNLLLNAGKTVFLVLLDQQSRVLKDREGVIKVRLHSIPSRFPSVENPFFRAIEIIENNRSCPSEDPNFVLLLATLHLLPKKATFPEKRGFENLRDALWTDLYNWLQEIPQFRGVGKFEIKLALSALFQKTDVLRRIEEARKRFYVFNPKSNFFLKAQTYIAEVLCQRPNLKILFGGGG